MIIIWQFTRSGWAVCSEEYLSPSLRWSLYTVMTIKNLLFFFKKDTIPTSLPRCQAPSFSTNFITFVSTFSLVQLDANLIEGEPYNRLARKIKDD